jgi:hypothetical protein
MLLEDLAKLGMPRASLKHDLPPSAVVSMTLRYELVDGRLECVAVLS